MNFNFLHPFLIIITPIVISYILYKIFFFLLKKGVKKEGPIQVVRYVRFPALALFLEAGAFFSLLNTTLPIEILGVLTHVLLILLIATLGLLLIYLVKGVSPAFSTWS